MIDDGFSDETRKLYQIFNRYKNWCEEEYQDVRRAENTRKIDSIELNRRIAEEVIEPLVQEFEKHAKETAIYDLYPNVFYD
jgi:hypothetical protein